MSPKNILYYLWNSFIVVAGVEVPGLPNYHPQSSAPKASLVPKPKVFTLGWTEPASTDNGPTDLPPSDADNILVADAQEQPALYKAAVDTIRLTNDYLVKSGCRNVLKLPCGYPKKAMVEDLASAFLAKFEDELYEIPPDLRTLWVTDKDYHPADKHIPWESRLWVVACRKFSRLTDSEKSQLLTWTSSDQQARYADSFDDVKKYNVFLVDMFMTYLAHQECDLFNQENDIDIQPSNSELDAFFQDPENQKGATIYDLHRAFHRVRNTSEFVRRIEQFAIYNPNPKPALGQLDIPEGAYFRKPIPSPEQIQEALHQPMTLQQLFESLGQLYEAYANGVGSQQEVFYRLIKIAAPDVTTGNFILRDTPGPNEADIWEALEGGPLSTYQLAACFPERVWDIEAFAALVPRVAYQQTSARDGRWVRMFLRDDGEPVGEENSRKIYALHTLLAEDPMMVLGWTQMVATWDGQTFVDIATPLPSSEPEPEPEEELSDDGFEIVDPKLSDEEPEVIDLATSESEPEVVNVATPPPSPKRKRDIEDDGEDEVYQAKVGQDAPKRHIKKARRTLDRCAYPQRY